jgi:predicted DCC family thiol-disulfide oxidoreductase YuxK
VKQNTIIYDGECGLCLHSVEWIHARDTRRAFEYLPYQDKALSVRFPGISRTECERALHLVTVDGSVLVGADALPTVLAQLPRWRALAPFLALPPLRPLGRWLYRRIAQVRRGASISPECALRP